LAETTASVTSTTVSLNEQLTLYGNSVRVQKERALFSLQTADAAFHACLADNNKLRLKFGLEPVSAQAFTGETTSEENRSINSYVPGHSKTNDDVFYDAEEGEGYESSSDSSEAYSMHDAHEAVTIIDDDSDDASKTSSIKDLAKVPATALKSLQPVATTSIPQSTQPSNSGSKANSPPNSDQKRKFAPAAIIRRTKLPVPASSMENISIMGILRNNVS
jgi:hypothetical protein